jgi:hypothetical protein
MRLEASGPGCLGLRAFLVGAACSRDLATRTAAVIAVADDDVRKSLVKRFPYGVLSSEDPDGILILGIMNLHRAPDYWKHRV